MKSIWKFSFIGLLFFAISISAFAVNYNFLSNSAMSYFTKDDWTIYNATQAKVLNNGKAGVKVGWKNAKSGSFGSMTPSAVTRENGMNCRKLAVVNNAHLIKGEGVYKFCKQNNQWKIY